MVPRFKAYDKKRNILFLPEVIDLFMDLEGNVYRDIFDEAQQGVGLKLLDKNRIILVRSTGLKDVKEKEIFESDIVELFGSGLFEKHLAKIVIKDCAFKLVSLDGSIEDFLCNIDIEEQAVAVIGNEYENPELLEA